MFTARFQEWVRAIARRFVTGIHLIGVTPNTLTVCGLAITAIGAVLVGFGYLTIGGIVLAFAALFDILDGAVARVTGKVYRYGAFLDSTTDRYAEAFTFMALLCYFLYHDPVHAGGRIEPMLVLASLTGSLLVSYVRARAQSLGFVCDGGLLARPERVIILVVGLILPTLLVPCLWILAVFTNLTAIQRIYLVWRESRKTAAAEPGGRGLSGNEKAT